MRAYGRISDREFCDLDILIQPNELARASLALQQRATGQIRRRRKSKPPSLKKGIMRFFFRNDRWRKGRTSLGAQLASGPRSDWRNRCLVSCATRFSLGSAGIDPWNRRYSSFPLCSRIQTSWERLKWLTDIAYLLQSGEADRLGCFDSALPANWLLSNVVVGAQLIFEPAWQ